MRFSDARLHAELSRCMYSEHGLDALMRPDRRARVPLVDRGVVLHAGVGALPRGLRDLAHQLAGAHRLDRLAGRDGLQLPVLVLLERPHELVGHPNRVVRVLVLDRVRVLAVEVHVEPGVAQRTRLVLLVGLAPDEVADVGVVDVEDHHLRRATRLAAGLDRAGATRRHRA